MASTRRSSIDRRSPAAKGNRRAKGVLVTPRILHEHATTLRIINAPNILSFSKKRAAVLAGRIHGVSMVNVPGSRRATSGSKPSGHGINAPRNQW